MIAKDNTPQHKEISIWIALLPHVPNPPPEAEPFNEFVLESGWKMILDNNKIVFNVDKEIEDIELELFQLIQPTPPSVVLHGLYSDTDLLVGNILKKRRVMLEYAVRLVKEATEDYNSRLMGVWLAVGDDRIKRALDLEKIESIFATSLEAEKGYKENLRKRRIVLVG